MGSKDKFEFPVDRADRNFSGWSDEICRTCHKRLSKAEASYSKRFFKDLYCRRCQKLQQYGE